MGMNQAISSYFNGKARAKITAFVLAGLALFFYRDTLIEIALSVLHREGSSHGLFVPFISAYFLWLKWERIHQAKTKFMPIAGVLWLCVGFILLIAASFSDEASLAALSLLFVIAGIVAGIFGVEVFKEASFPLFFLATMIPLPVALYSQISEIMRAITTAGSVGVLKAFGVVYYREAYDVSLTNITLHVAHGCSGVRYLLSYFVFGLAYAFLFKSSFKSGALVVFLTIPISVIGGVARLSSVFLAAEYIGPFMAGHRPHILVSWAVFGAVLFCAVAMDQAISKRVCRGQSEQHKHAGG